MTQALPFSISHIVNAPRPLVFLAHTDVAHLARWMGPAGFKVIYGELDLRVGGNYHYGIRGPDGTEMWGKQAYREIAAPEKLVLVQSFSDKDGGLTRHPLAPTWPLEMLATTTFDDLGDGTTRITVSWHPHHSDEAGNAVFDSARAGMTQGFTGTFANLDAFLATQETQFMQSRLIDAPRELVWRALTEPQHVNAWWGPDGFQNTGVTQDVRVGGEWKFTMVGPDGTRYPNLCTYLELQPPERIAYDHGDWDRVHFRNGVTLDEVGDRTLVTMTLMGESRAFRDSLLGFPIAGGQQTLAKLAGYVASMG